MRGVPIILRSAVVCAVFGVAVPVQGQYLHSTGYDSIFHAWELRELNQTAHASASVARDRAIVSADELRHPLSSKARHSLEDAKRKGESGDHSAAIEALRKSLIKYPA